jgi:CubicO group peptidase (beta-lactamase class C family)
MFSVQENMKIRIAKIICSLLLIQSPIYVFGQVRKSLIDSIRLEYKIPELGYAVISSDSILAVDVFGIQNVKTKQKAKLNDRFRIGSNTKTITSYIAAVLVKKNIIKYETKFFDLFPELKEHSNSVYWNLTLQDLLTFRANLIGWTYTNTKPIKDEIRGNAQEQRYAFVAWVLKQTPDTSRRTFYWSNPSYVAAGLMLEKVTGKSYELLVKELNQSLGIGFQFGQPNLTDKNQPWGHDENLEPEAPADNYKLKWLSSAGNINSSLPDYSKFVQLQLRGLLGKSNQLSREEFTNIHYGLPGFSYGWMIYEDQETHEKYSYHKGNPGTFLSQVFISPELDRAFILFTNVQSNDAQKGMDVLFNLLKKAY